MASNYLKPFIALLLLVCFTVSVSAADYEFGFNEKFINKLIQKYKAVLKEQSLHDCEFEFIENNQAQFCTDYKNFVPAKIVFEMKLSAVNQIDVVLKKFKIIGFIPAPRTTLANSIKEGFDNAMKEAAKTNPDIKGAMTLKVIDGDDVTIRINLSATPLPVVPEIKINNAGISNKQFVIKGDLGIK